MHPHGEATTGKRSEEPEEPEGPFKERGPGNLPALVPSRKRQSGYFVGSTTVSSTGFDAARFDGV